MRKLYKYEEFKLIREADEVGDEVEETTDGEETTTEEEGDFETDFDFTGDESEQEGNAEDSKEEEEVEEEVEEEKPEVFNENPSYYIEEALKVLEMKILSLFQEPTPDENGKVSKDESSYHSLGVVIDDVKTTDMPLTKTLIIKYSDENFKYHLMCSIDLEQGKPEKADINMDSTMVSDCGVKFKKYDEESNLIGQLDRKKVEISSIDQDFIDSLNGELDEKFSIDNGFKIEYGDEPEK